MITKPEFGLEYTYMLTRSCVYIFWIIYPIKMEWWSEWVEPKDSSLHFVLFISHFSNPLRKKKRKEKEKLLLSTVQLSHLSLSLIVSHNYIPFLLLYSLSLFFCQFLFCFLTFIKPPFLLWFLLPLLFPFSLDSSSVLHPQIPSPESRGLIFPIWVSSLLPLETLWTSLFDPLFIHSKP